MEQMTIGYERIVPANMKRNSVTRIARPKTTRGDGEKDVECAKPVST